MPPKNTQKLDPGTVYFHAPEGPQHLTPLDEVPDIEAATECAEASPCIKPDTGATLSASLLISPDTNKALAAFAEACKQIAKALGELCRAAADCVRAIADAMLIAQLSELAETQAAINEAPPRVRHLAIHGKKYRTQKKNMNRALREYRRRYDK